MENRDPSEGLREVEIPIMESCKREYNDIARQICAGRPEGGADACQGKRLLNAVTFVNQANLFKRTKRKSGQEARRKNAFPLLWVGNRSIPLRRTPDSDPND